MSADRRILHVDMDAFYASVEQRDQPELRGKPVLVGYDGPRGVVAAASYEARSFGCRSAQPIAVARRMCPGAIIVPVNMARYHEASDHVFAIFARHSGTIEPLSIDEAFLDVSSVCPTMEDATAIARLIKQEIWHAIELRASIGIATNKFLAKLASDLEKPDGLTTIHPRDVQQTLDPLAIDRIPGLGPASVNKLNALGVRLIRDLRAVDVRVLNAKLGKLGTSVAQRAMGVDDRPVTPDRVSMSISCEETFAVDLHERAEIRRILAQMVERVCRRQRKAGLKARRITIKLRFGDFETATRSTTLATPVDRTDRIHEEAMSLLETWLEGNGQALRLLGVGVSRFERQSQLDLFDQRADDKRRKVDLATDEVVQRFGRGAIRRGATLEQQSPRPSRNQA